MPWWISSFWLMAALLAALSAYQLYRALIHDRSRGRRRCPHCWYHLTLPTLKCPECGRVAPSEKSLLRTRRHYRRAITALLVLTLAYGAMRIPRAARNGSLWSALPLPILLLITQVYDGAAEDLRAQLPDITKLSSWERMLLARACAKEIVQGGQSSAPPAGFMGQLTPAAGSGPITSAMLITAAAGIPAASTSTFTAAARGGAWTPEDLIMLAGEDAKPAAYIFITALKSPNVSVRQSASQWLKWPVFRIPAAVGPLARGCADPDDTARLNCIDALADIGPPARAAFDAIHKALDADPEHIERMAILVALRLVAPDRAAAVLADYLQDPHEFVRCSAALGLEAIGPQAAATVPALRSALDDPSDLVRGSAQRALRAIERR